MVISLRLVACFHGLVAEGLYPYTRELLALEACHSEDASQLPARWCKITTPLNWQAWAIRLADHPDKQFVAYILHGIKCGFRVGFGNSRAKLKSRGRNMKSASENPGVVESYLREEVYQDRVVPVQADEVGTWIHTSPFGVIPKKRNSGKWRLIVDLSSPEGMSVNDGVDKALCSLVYISLDK